MPALVRGEEEEEDEFRFGQVVVCVCSFLHNFLFKETGYKKSTYDKHLNVI